MRWRARGQDEASGWCDGLYGTHTPADWRCALFESLARTPRPGRRPVQTSHVRPAVGAAMSSASALGLRVEDAVVLHASNKVAVRLLRCNVLARVADVAHQVADFEVELAQRLAETESPVVALEPRVKPRVYVRDGFAVTLWTYYEPVPPREVAPAEYARALERLHTGMRHIDIATPHFTDRVAEAQSLVANRDRTPESP